MSSYYSRLRLSYLENTLDTSTRRFIETYYIPFIRMTYHTKLNIRRQSPDNEFYAHVEGYIVVGQEVVKLTNEGLPISDKIVQSFILDSVPELSWR